jgi:hypothetical protein
MMPVMLVMMTMRVIFLLDVFVVVVPVTMVVRKVIFIYIRQVVLVSNTNGREHGDEYQKAQKALHCVH